MGMTLVVEVLLGAGADMDAVNNKVGCCMYVVNCTIYSGTLPRRVFYGV
jgi:hypothetical protein